MVNIKVKWLKSVFEVDVDPELGVPALKAILYSLTNVLPERQKVTAKGSMLKDDTDLVKLLKEGMTVMLVGSAEVIAAPKETSAFVEDMTEDEKVAKGAAISAGLINLGNTCYMNSTLQCLRHIPELRTALSAIQGGGQDPSIRLSNTLLRTLDLLDRSGNSVPPREFLDLMHRLFPAFGQRSPQTGGFMQHDAEEFYTALTSTVKEGLSSGGQNFDPILGIELEACSVCQESEGEAIKTSYSRTNKLECIIVGGSGAKDSVDHLQDGLKISLNESIDKYSEILGRNAIWTKRSRISKLPRYLCIQFMRMSYRPSNDPETAGVKCKILRTVTFPEVIDVYEFCSDNLQSKLRINREAEDKRLTASFQSGSKSVVSSEAVEVEPSQQSMEVDEDEDAAALKAALAMSVGEEAPVSVFKASSSSSSDETQSVSFGSDSQLPGDFTGLYELHGVVTHKGRSADSGHYIGWVRQEVGSDMWWKYDDDKVTEVSTADIMLLKGGGDRDMAYFVFYRFKEARGK